MLHPDTYPVPVPLRQKVADPAPQHFPAEKENKKAKTIILIER
jgi:hypothetical protein